jgi:hypothetical protein
MEYTSEKGRGAIGAIQYLTMSCWGEGGGEDATRVRCRYRVKKVGQWAMNEFKQKSGHLKSMYSLVYGIHNRER